MFKRFGWIPLVLIPVGALAGLVMAAVVTYIMPKKYESEATIEVKPFANAPAAPPRKTEGETPDWLLAEIEKMKSRTVLEKVRDGLELTNRWNLAKDEVLPVLNHTLLIQSIRGTDLVSIRVRHTNKIDARDIALEVARAYQSYRKEIAERDSARLLHELNKAVRNQEDKVEERSKVLATIARTKGLDYLGIEADLGARSASQAFHLLEQKKMQLESQISSLLKYDGDQLMVYAAGLDLSDNLIRNLYSRYQKAKHDLEGLRINGLGVDHPSVKSSREQIEAMKKQLDEGVVNMKATLTAQLDMTRERLKIVEPVKEEDIKHHLQGGDQSFAEAMRENECNQELLKAMKLKLISEEISLKMLRGSVEIHDSPVISNSPVSPNVSLNLVLGTVLGVILFPLMCLPVIGLLNRRRTGVES